MITKKQYEEALKTIAGYERQNQVADKGYQFMYYLSGEGFYRAEPKYHIRYIKAKSLDAAINRFLSTKPKSLVKVDYEVEHNGKYIDISNIDALQEWL